MMTAVCGPAVAVEDDKASQEDLVAAAGNPIRATQVAGGFNFTANISTYRLDPLCTRGPRLERIAEVLGLTGDLPVSEFHDAHRVRWQTVVRQDELSHPKVGGTEYASHREALLVGLRKTRRLNIASTADSLAGLRVLKYCIVAVNLVLGLEIIRV
jgi:hypothetical protein